MYKVDHKVIESTTFIHRKGRSMATISPTEQLKRLNEQMENSSSSYQGPQGRFQRMIRSESGYAPLLQEVEPLPAIVTNWEKALNRLGKLPPKIPPLPPNIFEILNRSCPIYKGKRVEETHFLSLIPQNLESLNSLKQDLFDKGKVRSHFLRPEHSEEYENLPLEKTHWVLMTKDVLPKSKGQTDQILIDKIHDLARRTYLNYQMPTLQQAFVAIATHEVATGEKLYPLGTYTRVQNPNHRERFVVGGFNFYGLEVNYTKKDSDPRIGVAALRVLGSPPKNSSEETKARDLEMLEL